MSIHSQAESYAKIADSYARGRPEYPAEMISWMKRLTGVGAGDVVVDLGAGTGKFTRSLVNLGLRVTAIEPVDEMRAQLSAMLPEVSAVGGVAQHLEAESASADLCTCAQSFHWFADEVAVAEIARVLKPGHFLVLVWNQRDVSNPIQLTLEEFLLRYQDPEIPHSPNRRWKPVIDGSNLFEFVEETRFTHVHELDGEGVIDRLRSMSVYSSLSLEIQQEATEQIRALVPPSGLVGLPYFSEAFAYRRVI
ncbi:MAG TPA: class I SAM-dependent methyltransferase [Acidimicrobiales bacterium]|nr:class I SAM-dependent methyltransferase [Acidimicrobiales bacterium]